MMKISVAVIFGGKSVEHEISIISAQQVMRVLDSAKYEIVPIYIAKSGEWYTGDLLTNIKNFKNLDAIKQFATRVDLVRNKNGRIVLQKNSGFKRVLTVIDVVLPVMHGTFGEDGTLQGYLETIGVPYVGCEVKAAAVGQDKIFMKDILKANNLPVNKYIWFYASEFETNKEKILKEVAKLQYPVIIKPATLGSSVGITIANDEKEFIAAVETASVLDERILVEEVISNLMEVNCSVLGDYTNQQVSVLEEVIKSDDILSYEDKYQGGCKKGISAMAGAARIIPAKLDEKTTEKIQELAKQTFRALFASGVSRIDFLINKETNDIYVNEINTIPGSLSFYLWDASGKDFVDLLDELIKLAIAREKRRTKLLFSYEANILENFNGTKGIKGSKGSKPVKF